MLFIECNLNEVIKKGLKQLCYWHFRQTEPLGFSEREENNCNVKEPEYKKQTACLLHKPFLHLSKTNDSFNQKITNLKQYPNLQLYCL